MANAINEQAILNEIIRMFYEGYTLYEISKKVSLTEEQVRRVIAILAKAGFTSYKNIKRTMKDLKREA